MISLKRIFLFLAPILLGSRALFAKENETEKHSYKPPHGYIADEVTAKAVAEAILIPIYGKEAIEKEKPLIAKNINKIWVVEGTMHCQDCKGGVAVAEISQNDGRILRVSHGE